MIGRIRFIAETLVVSLQTKEREKAMEALFEIIKITLKHLRREN
jgi:hypothetical protein